METPPEEQDETPTSIWDFMNMFASLISITLYGFKSEQNLWTTDNDTQAKTTPKKENIK